MFQLQIAGAVEYLCEATLPTPDGEMFDLDNFRDK